MKDFYQEFKQFLSLKFQNAPSISKNLISPHLMKLPKSLESQFKKCLFSFKQLGESEAYQNFVLKTKPPPFLLFSPLMGFDFHITPDKEAKLIEVNTNPAFITGSALLVDFWKERQGTLDLSGEGVKEKFLKSVEEGFPSPEAIRNVVILDESPQKQNFFFEFQCLKEWFSKRGNFKVFLFDPKEFLAFKEKVDLVYNRLTDFFLLQYPEILKGWKEKKFLLFPGPFLYSLFSDKTRLVDWWKKDLIKDFGLSESESQSIRSVLVESFLLKEREEEDVWKERKKYFFKPLHSFGGKAAYRGRSISKKKFQDILGQEMLVQEDIPPSLSEEGMKYDVRCYALRGEFQMAVARLYKGQVTNFQSLNGGFASIEWVKG